MKRFSEQLHKKATTVKLRAAEKRELRERVVSYMEYHPLPKKVSTKPVAEPKLLSEPFKMVAFPWHAIARWSLTAAVIMLVVVPIMAERSVPGDGLYAVKRFNEEVRSTLSFDTVQKVEWETERLNRRIAEARLLASEGRLTKEVEAEVAEAVRTQGQNVQKNIDVLRGEDADEATLASLALETTLSVQSASFNEDTDGADERSAGDTNSAPSLLAAAVEETRAEAAVKNASTTIPAYEKLMARVEINTTRVYELRDSLVGVASQEQIKDVTRRIEDIERSVAEAIGLSAEDEAAARAQLLEALQRTQRLIVFMTDIEVNQTVDIETIVPVVLTPEEKQTILADLEANLIERVNRIESALPDVAEIEIVDKATTILAEIETAVSGLSSSTEDFLATKATLEESLALAENLFTVLEIDIMAPETPVVETGTSTEQVATSTEPATGEDGLNGAASSTPDSVAEEQSTASSTDSETGTEPEVEQTATTTSELPTIDVDTTS